MSTEHDPQDYWPRTWQTVPPAYRDATVSDAVRGTGARQMLLIGPAGTGKTFQAWGLQQQLRARQEWPGGHIPVWIVSEALHVEAHRWRPAYLEALCTWPTRLVIDDLGYRCQREGTAPSEWAAHVAYCVADHRANWQLPTIWTSNLTTDRLADAYGPATASRIMAGAVVETGGRDRRASE